MSVECWRQIREAPPRQTGVSDICRPHMARPRQRHAAQQVRINLVPGMRTARGLSRRHARQAHVTHQASHALAVDHVARRTQEHDHASAAIKRPADVFLVDQRTQLQVALVFTCLPGCRVDPAVHCRVRHPCQLALTRQRQLLVPRFDPAQARLLAHGPSFY